MEDADAVVVGAGPNGLVAAARLAAAGWSVEVVEAAATVGGGARSEALTLPGFVHDVCSAVHPLGVGSPALRRLPLERHGLQWVHPELPLVQTLADGGAAVLAASAEDTAAGLGHDAARYRRLVAPFLGRWDDLAAEILRPVAADLPRHPLLLARFGLRGLPPAEALLRRFHGERAAALLAGLAAHALAPLSRPLTSAFALTFALTAHTGGWPSPRGGAQVLADALAAHVSELGGRITTGWRVRTLAELPPARAYLFDTSPAELIAICGDRLPDRYVARLRCYRPGPAVFKIDYALAGPVPWHAAAARRAGTVHVASSAAEIATALAAVAAGRVPDPPFLIAAQPTVHDPARAPAGSHVLWVYAHCPHGFAGDLSAAIERQLERFAPGFRDLVLARAVAGPAQIAARNPNNAGGDIAVGAVDGLQALLRPVAARVPYATPDPAIYLCSAATPPGPGVHGMCGWHAAGAALRRSRHRPA